MFNNRSRSTRPFSAGRSFGGSARGGFRGGGFSSRGGFRGRGGGGPKRVSDSTIHSYISRASVKPFSTPTLAPVFEETNFVETVEKSIAVSQDQKALFQDIDEEFGEAFPNIEPKVHTDED